MNILHHKSWHVRTKKNIEKVRRDEQKALEEQTEKARKADLAEQERRITELRGRCNVNDQKALAQVSNSTEHINFFRPEFDQRVNKAHELEKKLEQESWEKKVGILQYLGGNKREQLPWYEKPPTQLTNEIFGKDALYLQNNDPLVKVKNELNKRKRQEEELKKNLESRIKVDRKRNPFVKKQMREDAALSLTDQSKEIDLSQLSEKELKLKMLRDKRLKREARESKRSADLFSDRNLFDVCLNDRARAYSNQFNPHLARR